MSTDTKDVILEGLQITAIPTDKYSIFHVEVNLPESMPINKMAEYLNETKNALKKVFPEHVKLIVSKKGQVAIRGE